MLSGCLCSSIGKLCALCAPDRGSGRGKVASIGRERPWTKLVNLVALCDHVAAGCFLKPKNESSSSVFPAAPVLHSKVGLHCVTTHALEIPKLYHTNVSGRCSATFAVTVQSSRFGVSCFFVGFFYLRLLLALFGFFFVPVRASLVQATTAWRTFRNSSASLAW